MILASGNADSRRPANPLPWRLSSCLPSSCTGSVWRIARCISERFFQATIELGSATRGRRCTVSEHGAAHGQVTKKRPAPVPIRGRAFSRAACLVHRQSRHHSVAVNFVEMHARSILFETFDRDPIDGALSRQPVSKSPGEANDRGIAEFTFGQTIPVREQICLLDRSLPVAQECTAIRRQRRP